MQTPIASATPATASQSSSIASLQTQVHDISQHLANLEAQRTTLSRGQGGNPGAQPAFTSMPPRMYRVPVIDGKRGMEIIFILAVLLPISIGIMRRLAGGVRKAPTSARPDVDSQRLERLEQAVESIAIEVERISEGQRFVTKVFASNAGSGKNVESSTLDEATAARALGAGPVEPIRMPDRHAVRPSITPH